MSREFKELKGSEIAAAFIPTTVTLITARNSQGQDRVATIAWAMPISHEPSMIAVSIRPKGSTARAIAESGCFIVNVLGADETAVDIACVCGQKEGISDRFSEAALSVSEGLEVAAPRIDQAISWIECELIEGHVYGDHELFIGRTMSATTRCLFDYDGKLLPPNSLLMGQRGCFGHFEEGFLDHDRT